MPCLVLSVLPAVLMSVFTLVTAYVPSSSCSGIGWLELCSNITWCSKDPQLAARCAALHMDWVPIDVVLLAVEITVAGQSHFGPLLSQDYEHPGHFKLQTPSLPLHGLKDSDGQPLVTIDTVIYGWSDRAESETPCRAAKCMRVAKNVVLWVAAHTPLLVCLIGLKTFSCSLRTLQYGSTSA